MNAPPSPPTDVPEAVFARHGWNAAAVQALNPGLWRWAAPGAFAGFAKAQAWPWGGRVWMGAGEPVCAPGALRSASARVAGAARREGARVAWFGASERFRGLWRGGELVLGAQPVWAPRAWPGILARTASVRAQLNRARNKGVAVRPLTEPLAPEALARIERVRRAWLAGRGLPPLRFMVESGVTGAPGARRFLLARRGGASGGADLGALVLAPIPARQGVFVEWIWQTPEAPNGTAALLLDAAFRLAAAEGARMLTLGMVPLSRHAPPTPEAPPRHVRALLAWVRAHARRFYNFEGLERFKAKFRPEGWETLYLLVTEREIGLGHLHAVADAFAGPQRSPTALVGAALARAAREEVSGGIAAARGRLPP